MFRSSVLLASVAAVAALAPAVAGASTVSAVPEPGSSFLDTTFRAAAGGSDVTLASVSGVGGVWSDAAQRLRAGLNCTPGAGGTVTCPAGPAVVELGSGDDRLTNAFFAFDLTVRGRAGDDRVTANGNATHVSGGSGDDVLDLRANGGPFGQGDSGDDALRGGYPTNLGATLDGGSGDDLVVGGSHRDLLTGGTGDDQLFSVWGEDGAASGGKGDDVLVDLAASSRLAGFYTMNGDAGDDTLVGGRFDDALNGGPGDDVILAAGDTGLDAITCGTGDDTVYADAGDTVAGDCEHVVLGPAPARPELDEAFAHLAAVFPDVPRSPIS